MISYRSVHIQFIVGTETSQAAVFLKGHPNMELTKAGILKMSVKLTSMQAVHRFLTLGTLIDFIILQKEGPYGFDT